MNFRLGIILLFITVFSSVKAQDADTIHLKKTAKDKSTIVTDRPPQAVYFGIGGSGPLLSVNYDRRFSKKLNGPGFTVGLGYFGYIGASIISVPVSINTLVGRQDHFLELATGVTFITASFDWFDETETGSALLGHASAGYRYQPSKGGFFARGGMSPLFSLSEGGGYVTSYYLGLGYSF